MVALLIENVTLLRTEQIIVQARFRGGATTTLKLHLPLNARQGRKTPKHVLTKMDELLNKFTDARVAVGLDKQVLKTGADGRFTAKNVRWVRYANGLKSYVQRLNFNNYLSFQASPHSSLLTTLFQFCTENTGWKACR
jgi:hypothetical protein